MVTNVLTWTINLSETTSPTPGQPSVELRQLTQILRFSATRASPDVAWAFACCRLVYFKLNALGM